MTQHRVQFATIVVTAALLAAGSAWASLVTISDTCIPKGSCISIPVNITRGGGELSMRGFSINFTIDPAKLTLCNGGAVEGPYLKAANPSTTFLVTSNGGGSYTVDCVINGSPCGASAASGTLFYIQVTNTVAGPGSTTTSIPVSTNPLGLADCNLVEILPSTNGPAATVTINDNPCVPVPVELSKFTIE